MNQPTVSTDPGTATCILHMETYSYPDGECPWCEPMGDE